MSTVAAVLEPDVTPHDPAVHRRTILAGLAGNVMEWYDFAVYGYFAPVIGRQFFPADDPAASLVAAFGVFAAGFLMRPIGGLIFGHIGDRVGRRAALTLSVLALAIPTFLIGVLPGHAQLGVLGVLSLWAWPLQDTPHANHGRDPGDYLGPAPDGQRVVDAFGGLAVPPLQLHREARARQAEQNSRPRGTNHSP